VFPDLSLTLSAVLSLILEKSVTCSCMTQRFRAIGYPYDLRRDTP
jgi:hypothetical protein